MARLSDADAMKKLISEVFRLPSGSLIAQFYCVDDLGQPVRAVSETLLDLISEASTKGEAELEGLVLQMERGLYVPSNPDLPDWSVNDKYVWLRPPMAKIGHICVSNENGEDFSQDEGEPQQFTIEQFRAALTHWRNFKALMDAQGRDAFIGRRFETDAW